VAGMQGDDEDRLVSLTAKSIEDIAKLRDCVDVMNRLGYDPAERNWQVIRMTLYLHELETLLAAMGMRLDDDVVVH